MPALPPPIPVAAIVRAAPRIAHELPKSEATLRLDLTNLSSMLASYQAPDVAKLLTATALVASAVSAIPREAASL